MSPARKSGSLQRLTIVEADSPPECLCRKRKPTLTASWPDRRIRIEGGALNVYEVSESGEATPRGSSIPEVAGCRVVEDTEEFSFANRQEWRGKKKMIIVYMPGEASSAGARFAFKNEADFHLFFPALTNLAEGREWNVSRREALAELESEQLDWWGVEDVSHWMSLQELQRWPQDQVKCAQLAVQQNRIAGPELAGLNAETLEGYLAETDLAKQSSIDTGKLAEVLTTKIERMKGLQPVSEGIPPISELEPQPQTDGTRPTEPEPQSDGRRPTEPEPHAAASAAQANQAARVAQLKQ